MVESTILTCAKCDMHDTYTKILPQTQGRSLMMHALSLECKLVKMP